MTRAKEPDIGTTGLPNYKSPASRIVRSLRKARAFAATAATFFFSITPTFHSLRSLHAGLPTEAPLPRRTNLSYLIAPPIKLILPYKLEYDKTCIISTLYFFWASRLRCAAYS